jgi:GNAT superfamily N-acetyltransferase
MAPEDASTVARLCEQLGFNGTDADIAARLEVIRQHPGHAAFVATRAGTVVAWVHVYVAPSLLSEATAEIGGMVVEAMYRRQGVGSSLMRAAEEWAVGMGCRSVLLATQTKRHDAQRFYESLGFATEFATYFMRKAACHSPRRRLNSATT